MFGFSSLLIESWTSFSIFFIYSTLTQSNIICWQLLLLWLDSKTQKTCSYLQIKHQLTTQRSNSLVRGWSSYVLEPFCYCLPLFFVFLIFFSWLELIIIYDSKVNNHSYLFHTHDITFEIALDNRLVLHRRQYKWIDRSELSYRLYLCS